VLLWPAKTSGPASVLRLDHNALFALAFSPKGSLIATGGASETVIVDNTRDGKALHLTGHTGYVESVAFSPNGNTLASGSDDRSIMLWNPVTGQPIGDPLIGHLGKLTSVAFSPNGRYLASGSADQTAIVWNLHTGLGQPIAGHTGIVTSVAFGPHGTLLTGGDDEQVDVFPSFPTSDGPGAIDTRLCSVARRNLTRAEWREFLPGRSYEPTCPGYP
jgi:WD40 repeat protein